MHLGASRRYLVKESAKDISTAYSVFCLITLKNGKQCKIRKLGRRSSLEYTSFPIFQNIYQIGRICASCFKIVLEWTVARGSMSVFKSHAFEQFLIRKRSLWIGKEKSCLPHDPQFSFAPASHIQISVSHKLSRLA